jgi:ADP-ribose pyrophosphatase YjhB (NUDIX family)
MIESGGAHPRPRRRRRHNHLRTVHEVSAGGLVVDGLCGPRGEQMAVLIGRLDRRGRMLWSLPKGHIEQGERAEETAVREIAEETGVRADVLAALGNIDYWFVSESRRVHKTVHHYLLRFRGGELSDDDHEVGEVAWVPLDEVPSRLAHADERRLAEVAAELVETLHSHGPAALPPMPRSLPRRRGQTHSRARTHRPSRPAPGGSNGLGPGASEDST